MFIGREEELQYLNNLYKKPEIQILIVYGLRGIGKTALLQQFSKDKDFLYYEAVSCSTRQQRRFMAEHLEEVPDSLAKYPEYGEILFDIEKNSKGKKILVIDEFQNMCKTDNEFLETLHKYVNHSEKKNMFIILCSSSVGWIENTFISKVEKLSYMPSDIYKVKELKYQNLREYFPGFSVEDSIGAYSILGGIPGLWQYFNDKFTLRENIEKYILQSNHPLLEYAQRLALEELRETAVYNTLLEALACGEGKLNDIHLNTGFSRAKISVYLKNLMQLDIVEKVVSFDTEGRDYARKGLYRIKHSFVQFYYRYIFPNYNKLRVWETDAFYDHFIEPVLQDFISDTFRKICQEFLEKENKLGRLPEKFAYKGYWIGKKGNIDFIFQDEDEEILAGICNWKKKMMTYEDYKLFLECQKMAQIEAEYMVLFSDGKFDNRLRQEAKKNPQLALISLERMV